MAAGKAVGKVARNATKAASQKAKHGSQKIIQQVAKQASEVVESATQRSAKNVANGAQNVFQDFHMKNNGANVFGHMPKQTAQKAVERVQARPVNDIMDALDKTVARGYNWNQIETNKGQGFFKTVLKNASDLLDSPTGKKFDNHTGLHSFVKGFSKENGAKYEGSKVSKAMQNAGYIKKNKAGEITDINYSKIAKGYMAASVGARVVTGGGLYKDGQGNSNIAGIPLI